MLKLSLKCDAAKTSACHPINVPTLLFPLRQRNGAFKEHLIASSCLAVKCHIWRSCAVNVNRNNYSLIVLLNFKNYTNHNNKRGAMETHLVSQKRSQKSAQWFTEAASLICSVSLKEEVKLLISRYLLLLQPLAITLNKHGMCKKMATSWLTLNPIRCQLSHSSAPLCAWRFGTLWDCTSRVSPHFCTPQPAHQEENIVPLSLGSSA